MEYPQIDPVIWHIWGPIALNWYGLTYLMGFIGAWLLGKYRTSKPDSPFTMDQVNDFLFYGFLGVIVGGRVGYVLFYHIDLFLQNPLYLFKIYEGGMSFHGGMLGVVVAFVYFAKKTNKSFFTVADFFAPMAPIGLATGRIGNFINGELWGKPADPSEVPWAMIFPRDSLHLYRHPSQLYECALEGILLFLILFFFSQKKRPAGAVSALFLLGYGLARFTVEHFREPDEHLRWLAEYLSMGQILSLPMIFVGGWWLWLAYKNDRHALQSNG